MPASYTPLPSGPGAHPSVGTPASSSGARRWTGGGRGGGLLSVVVHSHRRIVAVLAFLALLFGSTALMHSSADPLAGLAVPPIDTIRRPFAAAVEQITPARDAAAAALKGLAGEGGAPATADRGADDEAGDTFFGSSGGTNGLFEAVQLDGDRKTDVADEEAGLSRAKPYGSSEDSKKRPRPFGKAGSADVVSPPADDLADEVDTQRGSKSRLLLLEDVDDVEAGTAHGTVEEAEADLLADQPGLAALEDAAVRAPMAAIGSSAQQEAGEAATGDSEGHVASSPLGTEIQADVGKAVDDDTESADAADTDARPKPVADAVPAGARPKIGTGGRLGSGAVAELKPPTRVGAGEKAGAVVKAEAGRRVGTGARPGAKGMGTRE